jgi:hypothetical protein
MLTQGIVDEQAVAAMESQDNIFPHLDYRVYRSDYRFRVRGSGSGNGSERAYDPEIRSNRHAAR